MKTFVRVGLVIAAVVLFGGAAAGQESPEDVRRRRVADERNIDRICNSARVEYQERRKIHARFVEKMSDPRYRSQNTTSPEEAQRAIRDSRAQVDESRETYCECLRNNYAKAGQLMPSEYERLCGGEQDPPDPDFIPPPQPPAPRTGYPEAPAGERSAACARERARYIQARQSYIDVGQPSMGREAEWAFREVPAAGFAYCDCMRRIYRVVPLEVAMFCAGFDEMRTPWPPLGPGVAPPPPDKDDKPPKPPDTVCAAEFQKYNALYQRLQAMPRESPERPELQRNTDAAFKELCECLRVKAPDKWRALCGEPLSSGPGPGGSGTSGPKPSKPNDPPPPPVPPPPPGAGPGSGGPSVPPPPGPGSGSGGSGTGSGGALPPPPAPTPTPPREASQVVVPGMRANVSFSGIVHPAGPDPHAVGGGVPWCRQVVSTQVLTIPQVTSTSFSIRMAVLPGNLICNHLPNGPVDCVGTFSNLFGQAGETTVRATGVTFRSGSVLGTLFVEPREGPFSASFSGEVLQP
jgi:hypothetical protein